MKGGRKASEPKPKFANLRRATPKELLFNAEQREMVEKELKDAKMRSVSEKTPWDGNVGSPPLLDSTDFGNV